MFDPLPEKRSAFAYHWLVILGLVGGFLGVAAGAFLFGGRLLEESETGSIVSFLVGSVAGIAAGWRLVMPSQKAPSE